MSEIWNEFEKIACAQGLVSIDRDDDGLVSTAAEDRKTPVRYDSLADDAIALLYGVKPDSIYDTKNKSIIEIAHPETAIVGRAYDAMNAVVENLHQRQDMMAYIALKMPNGHLTMRRYVEAKQDLVNSLVRSAFLLDNRNEEELMTLADDCATRLHNNQIKKNAYAWVIAGGVAALLAGAYWLMDGATTAQNVYKNTEMALEYLDPLLMSAGTPDLRRDLSIIKKDLQTLMKKAEQIYRVKGDLAHVRSAFETTGSISKADEAKGQAIKANIEEYIQMLMKVKQAIPQWVSLVKMEYEMSIEGTSDWLAKLRGIEGYLPERLQGERFNDEKFIEKLWGKTNWPTRVMNMVGMGGGGSEQSQASSQGGGLLEAINNELVMMNGFINKANAQAQQLETETPFAQQGQGTPFTQQGQLPSPFSAPMPSAPGASPVSPPPASPAGSQRSLSPLEELANQWNVS